MKQSTIITSSFVAILWTLSPLAVSSPAVSEDIQTYCNQMAQGGLTEEETQLIIEECINEQSLYLTEAPMDRESECYTEVDEKFEKLSEEGTEELDYESLFDQCMQRSK